MLDLDIVLPASIGGALIGLGTAVFLLGTGRIAGISGIFFNALAGPRVPERVWFLVGLLASAWIALALKFFAPGNLLLTPHWPKLVFAGLLVGFGTQLGSGCTSGHGVCGVANFSGRGVTATLIFMTIAALVVAAGFGGLS